MTYQDALNIVTEAATFRAEQWRDAGKSGIATWPEFWEADMEECYAIAELLDMAVARVEAGPDGDDND